MSSLQNKVVGPIQTLTKKIFLSAATFCVLGLSLFGNEVEALSLSTVPTVPTGKESAKPPGTMNLMTMNGVKFQARPAAAGTGFLAPFLRKATAAFATVDLTDAHARMDNRFAKPAKSFAQQGEASMKTTVKTLTNDITFAGAMTLSKAWGGNRGTLELNKETPSTMGDKKLGAQ